MYGRTYRTPMPTGWHETKGNRMHRPVVAGFAAAAVIAGALNVAVMGLAPTTALAQPLCSPAEVKEPRCAPPEGTPFGCDAFGNCAQIWCPASGMEGLPHWDRNGPCHTFWFDPNAPLNDPVMIEGPPPGPPPPPPPPLPPGWCWGGFLPGPCPPGVQGPTLG